LCVSQKLSPIAIVPTFAHFAKNSPEHANYVQFSALLLRQTGKTINPKPGLSAFILLIPTIVTATDVSGIPEHVLLAQLTQLFLFKVAKVFIFKGLFPFFPYGFLHN
jgi:hypothetical protein